MYCDLQVVQCKDYKKIHKQDSEYEGHKNKQKICIAIFSLIVHVHSFCTDMAKKKHAFRLYHIWPLDSTKYHRNFLSYLTPSCGQLLDFSLSSPFTTSVTYSGCNRQHVMKELSLAPPTSPIPCSDSQQGIFSPCQLSKCKKKHSHARLGQPSCFTDSQCSVNEKLLVPTALATVSLYSSPQ